MAIAVEDIDLGRGGIHDQYPKRAIFLEHGNIAGLTE